MQAPNIPENEQERLAELYEYGILDTPAEAIFDEIAELAATICGTRYGAVTLVDRDRQWFKAEFGCQFGQTSRDESVCGHAILQRELFIVDDLRQDPRFSGNPVLERDGGIRFYGGSPLQSPRGNAIGMLCVLDPQPHQLSPAQQQSLRQLADVLMAVIEAGRQSRVLHWFGNLLDNITDEIYIADPRTLRYLHANRAAQRDLGRSLDELRRMSPMDVTGETRAYFEALVLRLEQGEPFVQFSGVRHRASGDTYPVESRWQLLTTGGRPVILSLVQDVTERRRVERMKDEFVSVVNHELRTPLTSIHGAVKLLEQGAGGPLPAQAAHLVALASQNTDRLRRIVDDILDLDKIASGRMEFHLQRLDAREVLEAARRGGEGAARAAGVTLALECPSGLHLRADAHRLQQVLANLVSNAIKFAPTGSSVRLEGEAAQESVTLSVIDSGPGVPAAFRERVFERFAQAEMGDARAQGGSGLGLSIAQQMTQQMGGTIGFESRPGRTRFWVAFQQEIE